MMDIERKVKQHKLFYVLLALLLGLCFVRYTFQIAIPHGVLLAAAVLLTLCADHDELMAFFCSCIPLHTSFEYAYAVLAGVFVYVIKYRDKLRFNLGAIPIVLMVVWETIHCFGQDFAIVEFAARCVPLLLLLVLLCSGDMKFHFSLIMRVFAISIAVMCCSLIGKLMYLSNFNLLVVFANLQRLGMDSAESGLAVAGAEMNPNTLGIICVLGMTGLMQLRYAGQGKRSDIVLIVILMAFGIMTSSRTYLVCLALMGVLLLFSQEGSAKKKMQFLLGAFVVICLALLLMYLIAPTLLEYYSSRFREKDLTTGRLGLMGDYHAFIISSPKILFYGLGVNELTSKLMDVYQVTTHTPHNSIQELILAWGLPGMALFVALWGVMIWKSRQVCRKQGLINYIPLIILLVKAQAGQMLNSDYTMMSFSLAYLSMCANLKPEALQLEREEQAAVRRPVPGLVFTKVFAVLLRRAVIIALVSVLGAGAAFGVSSYVVTPKYQASTLLYVNNNKTDLNSVAAKVSLGDLQSSRRVVDSYIVILKARDCLNRIIEASGVDRTWDEVQDMLLAAPVDNTEVMKITVTSTDRYEAEAIAGAVAQVLPERIPEIIQGTSVSVVDYPKRPSRPSYPIVIKDTILGFILGFILSVLTVLLMAMNDRVIRSEEELKQYGQGPVLAMIPNLVEHRLNLFRRKEE